MCLILFAYRCHPRYELVLAANRDEYYDRATAPLGVWDDAPDILAGRDLQEGGTWLGITRGGRFAAITNYRDPTDFKPGAPSRGKLVSDYLRGGEPAEAYLARLRPFADAYNGFNLLLGEAGSLHYFSNRSGRPPEALKPGVYGLSNHLLDTPWPKLARGREALRDLIIAEGGFTQTDLMRLLGDRAPAPESEVPRTGLTLEWEIRLSPTFIAAPEYGTRSSTVLLVDEYRRVYISEQNWINFSYCEYRLLWPAIGDPPRTTTRTGSVADERAG